MEIRTLSKKLKSLVAKDKLELAIKQLIEVVKPPKDKAIILQSGRLNALKQQINDGTISSDPRTITRNSISIAILEIIEGLEADDLLDPKTQNDSELNLILSTVETIYEISNEILSENQKRLTPVFQHNFNRQEVSDAIASLYNSQGQRGNFRKWTTILSEESKNRVTDSKLKQLINQLIREVEQFTNALYNRHEVLSKSLVHDKLREATVPIEEVIKTINDYLDFLRECIDKIATLVEKIKSKINNK